MSRLEPWQLCYVLFPLLVLLHLYVSPFTKVEESFNIQAVHDILKFGVPTHNVLLRLKALYDHMTFPGAVPRTFIGALTLAAVAKPFIWLADLDGEQQQSLVRAILGLFNAAALVAYASAVRQSFGKATAGWYVALQASQFHLWYYASRTLPNMFAFGIATFALSLLVPYDGATESRIRRTKVALYLLTLTTIVFRSEIALLLASHCVYLLVRTGGDLAAVTSLIRRILLPAILTATVAGLLLTVSIDTFFWQSETWLWPELAAFLSNVFPKEGNQGASAWGTSPWHWYWTSALPRLLVNPFLLLLIPLGFARTASTSSLVDLTAPSFGYVALYSILAHKETRFLLPVLPPLTAAIARVADHVSTRRSRSLAFSLLTTALTVSTVAAALLSHAILLPISAQTYPGGHALASLHDISLTYPAQPTIDVHLTNLALQTGVTRFLSHPTTLNHSRPVWHLPGSLVGGKPSLQSQRPTRWRYDKSDNATAFLAPTFWAQFDYVVVEDPSRVIGAWDVVDQVPSLARPRLVRPDVGRGMLVLGPVGDRREDDGLSRLVAEMYGRRARRVYGLVHDLVREGWGFERLLGLRSKGRWSWTGGWWLHWGLETKLYVLKRAEHQPI